MRGIIAYLKGKNIHTPRIALARFLLAFGLLLTVTGNDLDMVANHDYTQLYGYTIRHSPHFHRPFEKADLFMMMAPEKAKVVVIIILLLVMTGFFPQVTGILFAWACFSIHNFFIINNGGDDLAFVLSFMLLPICLTDPRINTWIRKESPPSQRNIIANVAIVAIWVQAAWTYFDASFAKLFTPQWQNGTAVYYYTSHYRLGAPDWLRRINEWLTLTQFVRVLTWGTLLLELLLAVCVFFPSRIKRKFILPAIIFHFLIVINFGLITFFISIVAMLLLYLDDDDVFTGKVMFWNRR
jgi:antimicrobial peptide system SdpB family protein